jgi:hypothetical protein
VLAGRAGLAGLAVVGQALGRQASAESTDHPALAALDLRPWQFTTVSMLRTLATGAVGAAGVLVTANVLAAIPALSAARSRPGRVLRTE